MPSIGEFAYTTQKGILVPAKQEYVLFKAMGVDGYGVYFDAYRAAGQIIGSILTVADQATAEGLVSAYRSLQASYLPITIVDQFGDQWPDSLILSVDRLEETWIQNTSLGFRVATKWEVLITATEPD